MSLMMEMFLWMMRGGGGGGINPYSTGGFGGLGNPQLVGSMPGNPLLGNSMYGYPSGWGNLSPYSPQGIYSPSVFPGTAPVYNPYTRSYVTPYNTPLYGNSAAGRYGYHPSYGQSSTNPFYIDRYNSNSPYSNPYTSDPYKNSWPGEYDENNNYQPGRNYGSADQEKRQAAPVVIQPIIVSPAIPMTDNQSAAVEQIQAPGEVTIPPVNTPAITENRYRPNTQNGRKEYPYTGQERDNHNPLYGNWQGVNGEFLELGSSRFRLRSGESELHGTYQLKNGILKAEIPKRENPVYMQYSLTDGYLMFLSEDGQKMLFRRLP